MPSPHARTGAARPRLERLEARDVPATLVGLTVNDTIVTFDSAAPGAATATVALTGLTGAEDVVGIDFRPSNGRLYGVVRDSAATGANARVVTIDPATGATAAVGTGLTFTLTGAGVGVDFNPLPDLIRITTDAGESLRVSPATGALVGTDTAPFFEPTNDPANGFTNPAFFDTNADGDADPATNPPTLPADLDATGAGYTRNPGAAPGTFVTTLYAIDSLNDLLVRVGGADGTNPDGTPNSPNAGQTFAVDALRDAATLARVDFGPQNGFDIEAGTDAAFAVSGLTLYGVNLSSGAVTSLGRVGGGIGLTGLAVAPPAAGNGAAQLELTAYRFPDDRSRPLAVTVTRTGGTTGTVTVDFATADGTAVGGRDYLPAAGTLTFGPGETTQFIALLRSSAAVTAAAPERALTLTLSNPTGGLTLGGNQTATVTVPAVAANPAGRRFAAGQASGASQVAVYDGVAGASFTFTPFAGFGGGVRVAAGDVTGDAVDDLIVAAGPGGGPRIAVYDGATLSAAGQTPIMDFFAFETSFSGGGYVAAGDVNGDGFDDIIIGAGLGGAPRVSVLDGRALADGTRAVVANFFAYESTFRGGVFVAAGAFDGDAFDDIVAGASVGGGPRVQVFGGLSVLAAGTPTGPLVGTTTAPGGAPVVLANYFAYDSSFRNGVFVATGDVDGDGRLDVITGAGFGGAPDVRAFSGTTTNRLAGFFAFDSTQRNGAPVGAADVNADGRDEILVGAGIGGATGLPIPTTGGGTVRVFDATGVNTFDPLRPFGATFTGGVFVG